MFKKETRWQGVY